tara:strand:- start:977 stop:1090 length:114 start_codon:yes stop_codon:yes gene_type:complete
MLSDFLTAFSSWTHKEKLDKKKKKKKKTSQKSEKFSN